VRGAGGLADDVLVALAVDANGDIVATGRFAGTSSFGGTALVANGQNDMVVAKYSGVDGAHQCRRLRRHLRRRGVRVAVDASNNVYITGYFSGAINFGGSVLRVPFTTDLDVFVAKFTSAGAHVWSKNFTNWGDERGYGIAVDAAGNVAITGYFSNSIDFGGAR